MLLYSVTPSSDSISTATRRVRTILSPVDISADTTFIPLKGEFPEMRPKALLGNRRLRVSKSDLCSRPGGSPHGRTVLATAGSALPPRQVIGVPVPSRVDDRLEVATG